MVTEDGLVSVEVASRGMGEARVEGEIKRNGLEANIGIRVFFPNGCHHTVVELLELEAFG